LQQSPLVSEAKAAILAHQPVTRRERRKLEVRGRMVDAAADLFEEQGYQATTVAEICERADVATKTFFNYFPSKQHLIRELAHQAVEGFLVDLEALRAEATSTRERLIRFFDMIAVGATEVGPKHREVLTEIIHAASSGGDQDLRARQLREAMGAIIRDGVAAGDVTARHRPDTLSELILGAFYALMFNWANLEDYPVREQAHAMARLLGDTIAPGNEEN